MRQAMINDPIKIIEPNDGAANVAGKWWTKKREHNPQFEGLSDSTADLLTAAGYTTVQQIREAGEEEIRNVSGIGKVRLEEIKEWLCSLEGTNR